MSTTQGANPEATREPLPNKIIKEVKYQIQGLSQTDLREYTYKHNSSEYKDAKTDLFIYNPQGKLVLMGRGFGQRIFFWTPVVDAQLTTA